MRTVFRTILCCAVALAGGVSGLCQQRYHEAEWPLPATTAAGTPAPWHFGEVVAVATTAAGNILVLHRGAQPVMEFDVAGNFLRSWGEGTFSEGKVTGIPPEARAPDGSGYTVVYGPAGCHACGAHSIRVDAGGNIWLVDAAAHVVYKNRLAREGLAAARREGCCRNRQWPLQPSHGRGNRSRRVDLCERRLRQREGREVLQRRAIHPRMGKARYRAWRVRLASQSYGRRQEPGVRDGSGTIKGSKSSTPKAGSSINGGTLAACQRYI